MYLLNQDEINEAKQKYLQALNRVNLLLLKEHDLSKDESMYLKEINEVDKLTNIIKNGQDNSRSVMAEDQYLRQIIKKNHQFIVNKEKTLKGTETIEEVKDVRAVQEKYVKMMSSQFQSGIQQKLSMIRGKVDELKKKIKELNKEILSYEQEHLQEIDDYSLNLQNLEVYRRENDKLKQEIQSLK